MRQIAEIIQGQSLIHVESGENVRSVARQMADRNIGAVAVVNSGKLVGVFSERDLMSRVVARELDPDSTTVNDVMTREIAVASPEDDIGECLQKMQMMNCRHLPVTRDDEVIGMISLRDLLQFDRQRARDRAELLGELVTYSPDYES